jgi:hypothetical protein
MIKVNLPDGSVANFPDGTDEATITGALKAHTSGGNSEASLLPLPSLPSWTQDQGSFLDPLVGQGMFLGAGPIAKATLRAGARYPFNDRSYSDLFNEELNAANQDQASFAARHPIGSPALEFGGAASTMAIPFAGELGAAAKTLTTAERAAQLAKTGAKVGGVTGAIHGAATTPGGPIERGIGAVEEGVPGAVGGAVLGRYGSRMLPGMGIGAAIGAFHGAVTGDSPEDAWARAGTGALVGGGIGLTIPLSAAAIGKGAGYLAGRFGSKVEDAPAGIHTVFPAFERDAVTPQQIQSLSHEGMLADLGPNLQYRTADIAAQPGAGQTIVRANLDARQQGAGARIDAAMTRAFGAKANIPDTVQEIIDRRAAQASPLYDKAYATPIQITPPIAQVFRNSGPDVTKWMNTASRWATNEGHPIDWENPDTHAFDYFKRAMDDDINHAKGNEKRQNEARILTGMKDKLVTELDRQNPDYAAARKIYSDQSGVLRALDEGKTVFNNSESPDELLARMNGYSMAERDAYIKAAHAQVSKEMGTAKSSSMDTSAAQGSKARGLFSSDWNQKKLAILFGQDRTNLLLDRLNKEATATQTNYLATKSSETAARLNAAQETGSGFFHPFLTMKNAYQFGGEGSVGRSLTARFADKLMTMFEHGHGELANAQAAKLLTDTDPATRQKLMDALMAQRAANARAGVKSEAADRLAQALATIGTRASIPQATDFAYNNF